MKKLNFNPDFLIEIPNNEVEDKSKEYLTDQIRLKLECTC